MIFILKAITYVLLTGLCGVWLILDATMIWLD